MREKKKTSIIYNMVSKPTTEKIYKEAKKTINNYLKRCKNKPILLLLSAGSSFSLLPLIDIKKVGGDVTVGMLDERFDYRGDVNNFLQFKKTDFFKQGETKGSTFIDTSIKAGDTLIEKVQEFEKLLHLWKRRNKSGFVIITQGIGIDGHTAGIFPHHQRDKPYKEIFNDKKWITGFDIENKNPFSNRITPTFYFLKVIVDKSFVYIFGEEKRKILNKVMVDKKNVEEIPARIIHQMKDVTLITNLITRRGNPFS